MGVLGLPVGVLEHERTGAVQHADLAGGDAGGVPAGGHAVATRLEPVQGDRNVRDEVREDPQRVGAAADARGDRVGQPAVPLQHLGSRLGADHPLELPHQQRERVRAGDRTDQVVGVLDAGDPVAHGVVHGVLERLGAGLDGDDLGTQQPHPRHVQGLPLGVHLAHVDRALQAEQGGRRGRGDAVLTGARFGDDPRLAHPPGQQRLTEDVVDLVRTRVVEVFPLQQRSVAPAARAQRSAWPR